jgi:septal ring factor EnvC (AmiA/AmiB activator)
MKKIKHLPVESRDEKRFKKSDVEKAVKASMVEQSLNNQIYNLQEHIDILEQRIEGLEKWAEATDNELAGHWTNIKRIDENIIEFEAKIDKLTKKKK